MSIAIIRERDSADVISEIITNAVCETIKTAKTEFRVFDIEDIDLRVCAKDCPEREFDKYSKFGCKISSTCIDEHNKKLAKQVYDELSLFEELIIIVAYPRERSLPLKLSLLLEEMRKEKFDSKNADRKNCLIFASPGSKNHSIETLRFISAIRDNLSRSRGAKVIDSFIFDEDNGNYMMEIIPFVVRTFIDYKEETNIRFTGHWDQIKFSDMDDLSSEILHYMSSASILTVGALSHVGGEQIFSILGQRYNLACDLICAYYKNNIPSDLLNDLADVAGNYRKKKLHDLELELRRQEKILHDIGIRVNELKNQTEDSHLLE